MMDGMMGMGAGMLIWGIVGILLNRAACPPHRQIVEQLTDSLDERDIPMEGQMMQGTMIDGTMMLCMVALVRISKSQGFRRAHKYFDVPVSWDEVSRSLSDCVLSG